MRPGGAVRRQVARRLARLQDRQDPRRLAHRPGRPRQGQAGGRHRRRRTSSAISSSSSSGRSARRATAGIFYRGTEEYDHIYWSAPEYQLLDDIKGADNKTRLTCAGRGVRDLPVARRPPEAGRRMERDQDRREGTARRALAERRQAGRVRAREPRLGGEGQGEQVQGRGPTTGARSAGTSRCRATTKARSPSATSASARSAETLPGPRRHEEHEGTRRRSSSLLRGSSCLRAACAGPPSEHHPETRTASSARCRPSCS